MERDGDENVVGERRCIGFHRCWNREMWLDELWYFPDFKGERSALQPIHQLFIMHFHLHHKPSPLYMEGRAGRAPL